MRRWTGSTLVQIMAKPLSEPVLIYCQLDPKEHISMKFYLKFKYFHSWKCVCEMAPILSRLRGVNWYSIPHIKVMMVHHYPVFWTLRQIMYVMYTPYYNAWQNTPLPTALLVDYGIPSPMIGAPSPWQPQQHYYVPNNLSILRKPLTDANGCFIHVTCLGEEIYLWNLNTKYIVLIISMDRQIHSFCILAIAWLVI